MIAGGTRSDFKRTPVIDERPGWLKIMLPGKSSSESFMAGRTGAAGWVPDFSMQVKDQYLEVEVSAKDRTAKVLYKGHLLSTHKLEESLREPRGITGRSGFVMQKVSEHLERCSVEESLTTSIPDGTTKLRDQITLTVAKPHPRESICRGGAEEAYRRTLGTFRVDDDALWRGVKPGTPIRFVE